MEGGNWLQSAFLPRAFVLLNPHLRASLSFSLIRTRCQPILFGTSARLGLTALLVSVELNRFECVRIFDELYSTHSEITNHVARLSLAITPLLFLP